MHRTVWNILWIMIILLLFHNHTTRAAKQDNTDSSGIVNITEPTDVSAGKLLSQFAKNSIDSLFNAQVMQDHIAGAVVQIAKDWGHPV